ncbi:MAG: hypothetical protein R6X18_00255 [Chloroflexota bacterium]|jgi:indole-3-glycerol phosphate synthase
MAIPDKPKVVYQRPEVQLLEEVQRVLPVEPTIVGGNNPKLQTFEVDCENTA